MSKIVECVPNFSEGRSKEVIEAIANAIGAVDGCSLLDVDPGISTNRTVYTFVGPPGAVVEAALRAAQVAFHLIDMTKHSGEHPRMGALDVCPFIPVQNVTMEECVACAHEFGQRLSDDLSVPVYLYGEAASTGDRKLLSAVRSGQYEGLLNKFMQPDGAPDFGEAEFVPCWGATAVGARKFLIAYNINVLGTKEQAHRIALDLREQGRGEDQPGALKNVQAMGWYLEEANMAQISMNIADFDVTPLHVAYEEARRIADDMSLAVIGSQIVGVLPLSAMLSSAQFYCEREGLFILEEDQQLRLVVNRLGLNSLGAFSPKEKIIEYIIHEDNDGPLVSMDVKDFILTVGSRTPSPGGGSVAALVAALGSALGSMAGFLSYGNRKYESIDGEMRRLIPPLYKACRDLTPFIDADAAAFSEYMLALKLPKRTEEEISVRESAMDHGLRTAVQVPMTVGRIVTSLWPTLEKIASLSNTNCKSDLQVGVKCLETAVWGAYYNVTTNLEDIKNEEFRDSTKKEIDEILRTAQEGCGKVLDILENRST